MLSMLNDVIARYHDNIADNGDTPDTVANEQATADAIVTWITGSAPTQESDYTITKTQLEAFVANPPTGAETFAASYNSIRYLINPAFFSDSGFLGTYDETNSIFYEFTSGSGLAEQSTIPSTVQSIINNTSLDLSSIPMYVPAEVVSATIVVQ